MFNKPHFTMLKIKYALIKKLFWFFENFYFSLLRQFWNSEVFSSKPNSSHFFLTLSVDNSSAISPPTKDPKPAPIAVMNSLPVPAPNWAPITPPAAAPNVLPIVLLSILEQEVRPKKSEIITIFFLIRY